MCGDWQQAEEEKRGPFNPTRERPTYTVGQVGDLAGAIANAA